MRGYVNLAEIELRIRDKPKFSEFYRAIRRAREYHSLIMDLDHAKSSFSLAFNSQDALSPIVLYFLQSFGYIQYARAIRPGDGFKYVDSIDNCFRDNPEDKLLSDRILTIRDKIIAHHDSRIGSEREIDQFIKDRMFSLVENGRIVGTQAPFSRHLPSLNEVPAYLSMIKKVDSWYAAKLKESCGQIIAMGSANEIIALVAEAKLLEREPLYYMLNERKDLQNVVK